jgi:hypothetical protein
MKSWVSVTGTLDSGVLFPKTLEVAVLAEIFATKRSFGIGVGKENTMLILQQLGGVCMKTRRTKNLYCCTVQFGFI